MEKEYIDITNIEQKPELFLQIYKAIYKEGTEGLIKPQHLANTVLQDCKAGKKYAQFLVKPENPILIVCKKEGITRRQLAELLGVRVSRLENCLSRDTVSKGIMTLLKERFNYL